MADPGVVDEHAAAVEPAEDALHRRGVGDVERDSDRSGADLLGGARGCVAVDVR